MCGGDPCESERKWLGGDCAPGATADGGNCVHTVMRSRRPFCERETAPTSRAAAVFGACGASFPQPAERRGGQISFAAHSSANGKSTTLSGFGPPQRYPHGGRAVSCHVFVILVRISAALAQVSFEQSARKLPRRARVDHLNESALHVARAPMLQARADPPNPLGPCKIVFLALATHPLRRTRNLTRIQASSVRFIASSAWRAEAAPVAALLSLPVAWVSGSGSPKPRSRGIEGRRRDGGEIGVPCPTETSASCRGEQACTFGPLHIRAPCGPSLFRSNSTGRSRN